MNLIGIAVLSLTLGISGIGAPATEADGEVFVEFDKIVNHYKCYRVQPLDEQFYPPVWMSDQFKASQAEVFEPRYLCNPVHKNNTPIVNPDIHYVCFEIFQSFNPVFPDVRTSNQFGSQRLRPVQSELLCLPSKKEHI